MSAPRDLILPEGVRFDGGQESPRGVLLQFTDLAPGPAHGATFYLAPAEATTVALLRKTQEVRRAFRTPRPPVLQRAPRVLPAPVNHY